MGSQRKIPCWGKRIYSEHAGKNHNAQLIINNEKIFAETPQVKQAQQPQPKASGTTRKT